MFKPDTQEFVGSTPPSSKGGEFAKIAPDNVVQSQHVRRVSTRFGITHLENVVSEPHVLKSLIRQCIDRIFFWRVWDKLPDSECVHFVDTQRNDT